MPFAGFVTAGTIVNDAAAELGLISADVADPYASTDANVYRLTKLLKSLGQEIIREKSWSQSQKQYLFVTALGQTQYALPADFLQMINQTMWNRSNRLPVGGPLSPQLWEYLSARQVGVVFTVLFRPWQQQIFLYPGQLGPSWVPLTAYIVGQQVSNGGQIYTCTIAGTSAAATGPTGTGATIVDGTVTWKWTSADGQTPSGYQIAFEYMSSFWVQPSGQSAATTDAPTASTDVVLFDRLLMVKGLKVKFNGDSGFGVTPTQQMEYDKALQQAMGRDSAAPILRLNERGWEDPLLGDRNVPLTGFGS